MTDTRATQVVVEQWLTTTPETRATQVVVEQWATVAEGTPAEPSTGQARVVVMA